MSNYVAKLSYMEIICKHEIIPKHDFIIVFDLACCQFLNYFFSCGNENTDLSQVCFITKEEL